LDKAKIWSRKPVSCNAMDLRSVAVMVPLPALTTSSRKFCSASVTSPSVLSAMAIELRCDSSARWSVAMRLMRVSARSACAAPVGSSLARTTFFPEVRFSCRLDKALCRVDRLRSALS
jgi:hypothetical protein